MIGDSGFVATSSLSTGVLIGCIALCGAVLLSAIVSWLLLARERAHRTRERLELQTELGRARNENRGTMELAVRTTRRLQRAEEQLQQLSARLDSMQVRSGASDSGSTYDHAIRLVRRGADPSRLVADFGLSQAEAELMALMHGRPSSN